MKKKLSYAKGILAFMVLSLTFIACDKDYTTLGTDIIGSTNYSTSSVDYPVITYNKALSPIQTNGLPAYYLGVYNDPIYGKSSANMVSQLTLGSRTTGVNVQLDSVVVKIPYFSHINADEPTIDVGEETYSNYILDSVYGTLDSDGNGPEMKLSIFRNNYFLRDYDPETDFEDAQKYYSDRSTSEGSMIPISELESELIYESPTNDLFQIESDQIVFMEENDEGEMEETERIQPSMILVFKEGGEGNGKYKYSDNLQFWKEAIMDKMEDDELSNANNFKNYFRGLYFKLEEEGMEGAKALLNMGSGNITIYYRSIADSDEDGDNIPDTYDSDLDGVVGTDEGATDTDGDGITDAADVDQTGGADDNQDGYDDEIVTYANRTITLNFSGNIINFFEKDFVLNDGNETTGDEKLKLKGEEGSMAILDLFGIEDLDDIRDMFRDENDNEKKLRLINEANLVFYEDELIDEEEHEYDRIYVYDLNNNIPLIDYSADIFSSIDPFNSVINHLGQRKNNELGVKKYKIRITEHIKNIIYNDSTNTKLGLVISSNVNVVNNASILGTTEEDVLIKFPRGAVLSQRGTVLYGNNTSDEDKKVKLEIFYTEPETN